MKKLVLLALLVAAGQVAAWGQMVNIHLKDGSVLKYNSSIVDYVDFSETDEEPVQHEAVDLGLPSGLKWATCNIGATKPEEAGYFFAWGEVAEKEDYSWCTYKWTNECQVTPTKYGGSASCTLEPEDDAAHVLWGGSWRMPTYEEAMELFNYSNCTYKFATQNNVLGVLLTSKKNGNTLFLPIHGFKEGTELKRENERGCWWTSTRPLAYTQQGNAFGTQYDQGRTYVGTKNNRFYGFNIRAVTTE